MLMFILISIGLSGASTLIVGVHAAANKKQLNVPNISIFHHDHPTKLMESCFLLYGGPLNAA